MSHELIYAYIYINTATIHLLNTKIRHLVARISTVSFISKGITSSALAVANNALLGLIATTFKAPNAFASSLFMGEIDLSGPSCWRSQIAIFLSPPPTRSYLL